VVLEAKYEVTMKCRQKWTRFSKALFFAIFDLVFLYFCSSLKNTTVWKIGAAQKLFMHPSGG